MVELDPNVALHEEDAWAREAQYCSSTLHESSESLVVEPTGDDHGSSVSEAKLERPRLGTRRGVGQRAYLDQSLWPRVGGLHVGAHRREPPLPVVDRAKKAASATGELRG